MPKRRRSIAKTKSLKKKKETGLSLFSLDLDSVEEALAIGKQAAERTGRTVTVQDAEGRPLATFRGTGTKH